MARQRSRAARDGALVIGASTRIAPVPAPMYVRCGETDRDDGSGGVKPADARILAATALIVGVLAGGCGGGDEPETPTATGTVGTRTAVRTAIAPGPAAGAVRHGPIPRALRAAESDSEDTIDLALAGRRDRVVATARALKAVADGPARSALREAGVSEAEIAEFRARAAAVDRLAPRAPLLRVAIASNRAFAMIAGFFARYESPIPPQVSALDHLDFEAKLQAKAGDAAALRSAVNGLARTWGPLRARVVAAGGARAARRFDAHVARMRRLAATGGEPAAREAQHGLDLVDEIEDAFRR